MADPFASSADPDIPTPTREDLLPHVHGSVRDQLRANTLDAKQAANEWAGARRIWDENHKQAAIKRRERNESLGGSNEMWFGHFYISHLDQEERDRIKRGDFEPREIEMLAKGEDPWGDHKPLPAGLEPPETLPPFEVWVRNVIEQFSPVAERISQVAAETTKQSRLPRETRDAESELGATAQFDRIVSALVDGNEEQRASVLQQIRISSSLHRPALAARLRSEIQSSFGAKSEDDFHSAIRDPKKISSIRSWMISCLIWSDAESAESSKLLQRHVRPDLEPDRNVRFWTLAGLYQRQVSYLPDVAERCLSDDAPEVAALARAIRSPGDSEVIEQFRSDLHSNKFETAWRVLRLLRIVPITELAGDVCQQLNRSVNGSAQAYDSLYALANPVMATAASPLLTNRPGVEGLVRRVITEARGSNENAIRDFTGLLTAFDRTRVDAVVEEASRDPATSNVAQLVRRFLAEFRRPEVTNELYVPGYASDTIDVEKDPLDIREDVQALTAIMLAKEAKPPLAIGLFGNWGSGKSTS